MNRYDGVMSLAIMLVVLMILAMFIGPVATKGLGFLLGAAISILYIEGLMYWCWRIYITASALIEPANPEQGRKGVFLLPAIGVPVLLVATRLFELNDRADLIGLVGNAVGIPIILDIVYAIWLTAKALNGIPAKRFALFHNGAMLAYLQIFYLPFGLYFMRRRLRLLFPD